MSFHDCISQALNSGRISQEEAEDLRRRWERIEEAEQAGVNGPERLKAARQRLVDDLREEALEKQRIKLLTVKAKDAVYRDIRRYAIENDKADLVGAIYAMFEHFGTAGYSSARGISTALLGAAHSEMADLLHHFRRSALTMKRMDRPMLDDVARAGFGENVSDTAQALYRAWRAPAEKLRKLFNEAGGHIGWREDYGFPNSHNPGAIITAGFEKWSDFVGSRLDWEKMAHSVSGAEIRPEERDDVLRHVYDSIVSDGWNKREPAMSGGGAALYNRRSDPRFLVFKDAESWLDYNRSYGKGDVFNVMTDHMKSLSRDIALMQRFGPNPAAMVNYLKQLVDSEGAKLKRGEPSLFPETSPRRVDSVAAHAKQLIDGFYDVARGSAVPNSVVGDVLGTWRNVQYGAKLGGAVIMHATVNPVIMGMGRYLQGHPLLSVPLDILKGFADHADVSRAGMIVQDAMNTLERGAREEGSLIRLRELSNWLPAITTHYSGLEALVEANRRAAFLGQMTHYASLLDRDFKSLPDRVRNVLQGFGLDEGDWRRMREAEPYQADGSTMLRFQDVMNARNLDAMDMALREQTAMKYLQLLHGSTELMVPSSNWRIRAQVAHITKRGGLQNEVLKSAMMFKSGFMATFMLTQMQMGAREIQRHGVGSLAAYAGVSAIALTLAGMLALQAKNLRAGKDLRSMDPTTKEGRDTWMHAFLTSGALGTYGDFIASDRSAYGHDLASTLLGPEVSGAVDAFSALHHGLEGKKGIGQKAADAALSFARNNTPFLSTSWALQAAYNRVLLDHLQYLADPQAHQQMRNMQRKVMKETGQGFFWPPGSFAPERLPGMAGGR